MDVAQSQRKTQTRDGASEYPTIKQEILKSEKGKKKKGHFKVKGWGSSDKKKVGTPLELGQTRSPLAGRLRTRARGEEKGKGFTATESSENKTGARESLAVSTLILLVKLD